jgi:hypothetical protein
MKQRNHDESLPRASALNGESGPPGVEAPSYSSEIPHRVTPMRLRCKAGFWMTIVHDSERGQKEKKKSRTKGKLSIFIRVAYDLCF